MADEQRHECLHARVKAKIGHIERRVIEQLGIEHCLYRYLA